MRHRRSHADEGVELNLASMLDMAFQLLAFFILTFKPNPAEMGVALRLPPPVPAVTSTHGLQTPGSVSDKLVGAKTVTITVLGRPDGKIRQIAIGDVVTGEYGLEEKLRDTLGAPGAGFDQVLLQANSTLSYESLMRVIDSCTHVQLGNGKTLGKLSFVELAGEP
jgi:biopolymer transport protein ExbD